MLQLVVKYGDLKYHIRGKSINVPSKVLNGSCVYQLNIICWNNPYLINYGAKEACKRIRILWSNMESAYEMALGHGVSASCLSCLGWGCLALHSCLCISIALQASFRKLVCADLQRGNEDLAICYNMQPKGEWYLKDTLKSGISGFACTNPLLTTLILN